MPAGLGFQDPCGVGSDSAQVQDFVDWGAVGFCGIGLDRDIELLLDHESASGPNPHLNEIQPGADLSPDERD